MRSDGKFCTGQVGFIFWIFLKIIQDAQNCQFNFGFREVSQGEKDRKIVISVEEEKGKSAF